MVKIPIIGALTVNSILTDYMRPYSFVKEGSDKVYFMTTRQIEIALKEIPKLFSGKAARVVRKRDINKRDINYEVIEVRVRGKVSLIHFQEDLERGQS